MVCGLSGAVVGGPVVPDRCQGRRVGPGCRCGGAVSRRPSGGCGVVAAARATHRPLVHASSPTATGCQPNPALPSAPPGPGRGSPREYTDTTVAASVATV